LPSEVANLKESENGPIRVDEIELGQSIDYEDFAENAPLTGHSPILDDPMGESLNLRPSKLIT